MSRLIPTLACLLVVGARAAHAQGGVPSDLPARVDRIFARYDRQDSPGCGVGLGKDGRALYTHGYGSANLEYGVPNTDSTVWESGSVAKQFTAAALVLLAQDGTLGLDDDIRKYLPEVPSFGGARITIRNLLTHTSGLRDQWGLLGIEGRGPGSQVHSPATTLDLVVHQKMLNFPPGTQYLYSNTGYALAGIIVQRVSKRSLDAFLQERVFKPLGMHHTQLRDDYTEVVKNRATAYAGSETSGYHTDMPFTNMVGNGGVLSTMGDLLTWNEHLQNPTVFGGKAFVDSLETRARLRNGRTITYALGLEVSTYDGVREVSHGGSTAGYRTFLARYPDQHVSVAVWCNYAAVNPTLLAHQVADLVLTKPAATTTAVQSSSGVTLSASDLARYAGLYRNPQTDEVMRLEASTGTLSMPSGGRGRGGAAPAIVALGDGRFRLANGVELAFDPTPAAGRRAFRMIRADGDTVRFEEARQAPASIQTADYVGTYTSDELDVHLEVVARDGTLVVKRRPAEEIELRPSYADDFQAQGAGTFRFTRDAGGKVTGLSIYAGRVLDVRFKRSSLGRGDRQ